MYCMRIIKRAAVIEFGRKHAEAAPALQRWLDIVIHAEWHTLADVRTDFRHADPVKVKSGGTVIVFNIAGNKFRLITAIHYNRGVVYTLRFLTHAEYSKNRWKDEL